MSTKALNWAFDSTVKPSSAKFVLVALADFANESGEAYPSIETLCRKTCLDRKTVISHLQFLLSCGAIEDTNGRRGRTKQVKVYRLSGFISETQQHPQESKKGTESGTVPFFRGKSTKNGIQNHQ